MSKQPTNCPLCDPSIVILRGVKFCELHASAKTNENVATAFKVTLQENLRALKRGLVADLSLEQVLMARWYFAVGSPRVEACTYCRQNFVTGLDHWKPIVQGGGSTVSNVLPCCNTCNTMKGTLTGNEFLGVMIDVWHSTLAEQSKQEIDLYWKLLSSKEHAIYEYCVGRKS